MIAISRADVRRFRAVARRCAPSGRPRGPSPPARVSARGGTVTLAAHLGDVVVALRSPAAQPGSGSVAIALADFDRIESVGSGVVTFESAGRQKVVCRWEEGATPRSIELEAGEGDPTWPDESDRLIALPPTFPMALHEAGRTAARESSKYAAHRIQLRGKAGEVIGTDGKQALVQSGFKFPFAEDLLVPAVPMFGSKELASERAVSMGLAGDWLCLVVGPWQVWLAIDREGRFPDVQGAIPRACAIHVVFSDRDAESLIRALPALPGAHDDSRPVTLETGPLVHVRARAGQDGEIVEVPLTDTQATGHAIRLVLNRVHLGRALALGFRDFRCRGPDRPVCARVQDRIYLTATLDPSGAVPPPDVERRESGASTSSETFGPVQPESVSPVSSSPERIRSASMPTRDTASPDRNGHAEPATGDMTDPLAEAEALRATLADAANRANRLVATLKQFRKERRALASAWSSLRQLNLGP